VTEEKKAQPTTVISETAVMKWTELSQLQKIWHEMKLLQISYILFTFKLHQVASYYCSL
jgi:hypothetical protein